MSGVWRSDKSRFEVARRSRSMGSRSGGGGGDDGFGPEARREVLFYESDIEGPAAGHVLACCFAAERQARAGRCLADEAVQDLVDWCSAGTRCLGV